MGKKWARNGRETGETEGKKWDKNGLELLRKVHQTSLVKMARNERDLGDIRARNRRETCVCRA